MTPSVYPSALEETYILRSGRAVLLRPIRPADEPQHFELLARLAPEDIRFRFFGSIKSMTHEQMARFTEIDYEREMAFIATAPRIAGGGDETLGVVRIAADAEMARAEFAIVIRSDVKGQGLGWKLLSKIIDYCRGRGIRSVVGQVLPENRAMLGLARELGFHGRLIPDEGVIQVTLDLRSGPAMTS